MVIQAVGVAKRAIAVCLKVVARVYPVSMWSHGQMPRPKVPLPGY